MLLIPKPSQFHSSKHCNLTQEGQYISKQSTPPTLPNEGAQQQQTESDPHCCGCGDMQQNIACLDSSQ
jgi:hypothetical protein